jgi:hypothetical protein
MSPAFFAIFGHVNAITITMFLQIIVSMFLSSAF